MISVWRLACCGLLLFGLAGCRTPSPTPEPLATVTVDQAVEIAPPAPIQPQAPTPPPVTNPAPPKPEIALPAPALTNLLNTWVSLESWGEINGLGKPARLVSNPHPQYQFQTTNGLLSIKIGSRVARCDNLECWLDYAPQFIKGQPHIHWLDAQKSFQPLVRPAVLLSSNHRGTIVIDPGHGGIDCGARSVYNRQFEKDYALDWALRLRPLLALQGWKVVLTRTNDSEISLTNRVTIADRASADLFLSLHFNSGMPNQQLAGLETYCLTPTGMPSNLLRTSEDDLRQVFPNNAFDETNYLVAFRLHRSLIRATGTPDRGVRRARFMGVLRNQHRPAVLIEGGYLSNLQEARKIASPEYRQALAKAVANALEE